MELLMPLLPEELQRHVGQFSLRGMRNYSVQVPVSANVIREVKGIWNENMKAKKVVGPHEAELFVTLQKSPEQKLKYAAMGRLYEFVQNIGKECNHDFKAFWAPDFCVYAVPQGQQQPRAVLIASLATDNSVTWEKECEQILGVNPVQTAEQFAVFRRK